jgi:hypothetical protein
MILHRNASKSQEKRERACVIHEVARCISGDWGKKINVNAIVNEKM